MLAGFVAVLPVKADSLLTYTDTEAVSPVDTRFDPAAPVAFNIPQFNSSLGTLVSVTLSVSGSAISSLNFINNDGPNAGVRASQTNALIINYNAGILAENNFVWLTTNYPALQKPGSGGVFSSLGVRRQCKPLIPSPRLSTWRILPGQVISPSAHSSTIGLMSISLAVTQIVPLQPRPAALPQMSPTTTPGTEPSSFSLLLGGVGLLIGTHRARRWNFPIKNYRAFADFRG